MTHNIAQAIFDSLVTNASRTAFINCGQAVRFVELLRRSACLARVLNDHGLRAGGVVIFCQQDTVDVITSVLAAWRLAATPLVMDFRSPAPQRALISQTIAADLLVENRRPAGNGVYDSILWDGDWLHSSVAGDGIPTDAIDCSHPAFLTLSSGTTGNPKIYVESHRVNFDRLTMRIAAVTEAGNTFFTPMTLSLVGTRNMVLTYLLSGGTTYVEPPVFSSSEVIENLLRTGVSGAVLPPPIIHGMIRQVGSRAAPLLTELKTLRSIGGPTNADDKLAAYHNLTPGFCTAYSSGLTGQMTLLAGGDVVARPETVGRIVKGVSVDILDPNTLGKLPLGEIGLVRGHTPYVVDKIIEAGTGGYPERRGEGWGIPGDLGFVDDQGFLTLIGREADLIVRGGINVSPQEIEAELRRDERIVDVGVAGVDDTVYGQEIAAFVVTTNATEADIHEMCMKAFALDRRPRIIKVVPKLPYSNNGKLLRNKLAELL